MKYSRKGIGFGLVSVTIIALLTIFSPVDKSHATGTIHVSPLTPGNMASLRTARSTQNEPHEGLYSGGSGEAIEDAVIINATSSLVGIPAEYHYISSECGRRKVDWTLNLQEHIEKNGRHYDVLTVVLKSGEVRKYYFDITKFYGKF